MSKTELNLDAALELVDKILARREVAERRRVQVQSAFLKEVVAAVKGTKRKKRSPGVRKKPKPKLGTRAKVGGKRGTKPKKRGRGTRRGTRKSA